MVSREDLDEFLNIRLGQPKYRVEEWPKYRGQRIESMADYEAALKARDDALMKYAPARSKLTTFIKKMEGVEEEPDRYTKGGKPSKAYEQYFAYQKWLKEGEELEAVKPFFESLFKQRGDTRLPRGDVDTFVHSALNKISEWETANKIASAPAGDSIVTDKDRQRASVHARRMKSAIDDLCEYASRRFSPETMEDIIEELADSDARTTSMPLPPCFDVRGRVRVRERDQLRR